MIHPELPVGYYSNIGELTPQTFAGLEYCSRFSIYLRICSNTGQGIFLAEVEKQNVRFVTGMHVQINPGFEKHILVTKGKNQPLVTLIDIHAYGTNSFLENPVPILDVYFPNPQYIAEFFPHAQEVMQQKMVIPVIPDGQRMMYASWRPFGFNPDAPANNSCLIQFSPLASAGFRS